PILEGEFKLVLVRLHIGGDASHLRRLRGGVHPHGGKRSREGLDGELEEGGLTFEGSRHGGSHGGEDADEGEGASASGEPGNPLGELLPSEIHEEHGRCGDCQDWSDCAGEIPEPTENLDEGGGVEDVHVPHSL